MGCASEICTVIHISSSAEFCKMLRALIPFSKTHQTVANFSCMSTRNDSSETSLFN